VDSIVWIAYLVGLKAGNRTLKKLLGFLEAGGDDKDGVSGKQKSVFSMSAQSFVLTIFKRDSICIQASAVAFGLQAPKM